RGGSAETESARAARSQRRPATDSPGTAAGERGRPHQGDAEVAAESSAGSSAEAEEAGAEIEWIGCGARRPEPASCTVCAALQNRAHAECEHGGASERRPRGIFPWRRSACAEARRQTDRADAASTRPDHARGDSRRERKPALARGPEERSTRADDDDPA